MLPGPANARSPAARLLGVVGVPLLLVVAFAVAGREIAVRRAPLPPALFNAPPTSRLLTDRHGRPLRELPAHGPGGTLVYSRPPLAPADVPPLLRAATLAAEDGRFPDHDGVDGQATLRALASRLGVATGNGRRRSGGSTITQQLLKLAWQAEAPGQTVGKPRGWRDKLAEVLGAWRLERTWSKDEILAAYLARLPYGRGNVGCVAAAGYYFGKFPAELSPAEAALLAALPQAPSRLDPHRHPERARRRQAWVLGRMRQAGSLTEDEWQRAAAEAPRLAGRGGRVFRAGHFVDLVLAEQVGRLVPKPPPTCVHDALTDGGLGTSRPTLSTTLDLALQEFTEDELRRQLAALADRRAGDGAVVVLDNRTGDVLALVGSPDYHRPRAGQVNGAWAARSPGSALKPFTYWLAFETGDTTPATVVPDLPAEFPTATGVYRPENYGRRLLGPVRLRTALACSLNIPAVRVLFERVPGGPAALRTRLRDGLGLTTLGQPADHYGLGLTLGSGEVRLLELTNAYATLARGGVARPYRLRAATDATPPPDPGHQVGDARAAFLVADILADPAARAASFGLETPLRWGFPVAVKTGTSTDFRDNWAFGFTPEFTVGVWVGNFDGSPMAGVSGVSGAGPLLHAIFERLHAEHGTTWFVPPDGIAACWVHPVTGKRLANDAVAASVPGAVREQFLAERLPALEDPTRDYDAAGRVRLPAAYANWLAGGQGGALAAGGRAVATSDGDPGRFAILSPAPGSLFLLDPDLPAAGRRLTLRTTRGGAGTVRWDCATLATHADGGDAAWAELREGQHVLRAYDPATGERRETTITVRGM